MQDVSPELLKAIAVTAELTGTTFSEPAIRVLASDLAQFPERQVLGALLRCRRELRSTLTLAAILERIEDGRPGPEEAWAAIKPMLGDESVTVCWTPEMAAAYWAAANLADDQVAARMAFLETYRTALQGARSDSKPISWAMCLGSNANQRETAIVNALENGQIALEHAKTMLPYLEIPDTRLIALTDKSAKRLTDNRREPGED